MKNRMRFPPPTPLVKTILFVITGCFVTQLTLEVWMGQTWVQWLALFPEPGLHTLWQIFSYPIYQSPRVFDFLLGAVFFWWCVSPYELAFGKRLTLGLLVVSSLASAIPVVLFGAFFSDAGSLATVAIGPLTASPLFSINPHILGVIAAYAWSMRFRGNMNLFGMLSLSSKQLLLLLLAITGLQFLATTNITMVLADLGAIGGGLWFTEQLSKGPKTRKKKKPENKAGLRVVQGGKDDPPQWLN